jgi:hypothetical protein
VSDDPRKPRLLRWGFGAPATVPKHPYRDTLFVYGFFAVLVVVGAWATGGSIRRAVIVAAIVFVAASAYSMIGWRRRLRAAARRREHEEVSE